MRLLVLAIFVMLSGLATHAYAVCNKDEQSLIFSKNLTFINWLFTEQPPYNRVFRHADSRSQSAFSAMIVGSENEQKYLPSLFHDNWLTLNGYARLSSAKYIKNLNAEDIEHADKQLRNGTSILNFYAFYMKSLDDEKVEKFINRRMQIYFDKPEVQKIQVGTHCSIYRQVEGTEIIQTFVKMFPAVTSDESYKCIATAIYAHYGFSNFSAIYDSKDLIKYSKYDGRPNMNMQRFVVSLYERPSSQMYIPLGSDICEAYSQYSSSQEKWCIWNQKYIQDGGTYENSTEVKNNIAAHCKQFDISISD